VVASNRKLSFWAILGCGLVGTSMWLVFALFAASPGKSEPVPASFFGLQMHKPIALGQQPWPTIPFGAVRLWDSGVSWSEVNTANGVYDWELFDKWMAKYHEHGIDDILYTFGRVPRWATSKPDDDDCAFNGKGQCDPPSDLKPDGSGPNQYWKDFVSAIATHSKNNPGPHIRYWEIWNEPHTTGQWKGTNAQLIRMAQDARKIILGIDPNAVIVSPSSDMKTPKQQEWMADYLHDGGGETADVIAFHGYIHTGRPNVYPAAADIISAHEALRRMMQDHGLAAKAVFDTEASWGRASSMGFEGDEDFEAGFLAQFYILQWSAGIQRFYWYAWNNEEFGTLWSPDPSDPSKPGNVHQAAVAYEQLYQWMVGARMQPLCASTADGVWTCGLQR
jgi:polysaccharide biosynthesis protein PslG